MQQHVDWLDGVTVGELSAGQQLNEPDLEHIRNEAEPSRAWC